MLNRSSHGVVGNQRPTCLRVPQGELEDQTHISTSFEDLCDQNVIVYLLRTNRSYRKGVRPYSELRRRRRWPSTPAILSATLHELHDEPCTTQQLPKHAHLNLHAGPFGGWPLLHELLVQGGPVIDASAPGLVILAKCAVLTVRCGQFAGALLASSLSLPRL